MEFNYEVIATMAADLSKQMLKLNNQLDKIIDKQNELNDANEQQQIAIELINEQNWEEAAKLCADQAKEEVKRSKLSEEEGSIRTELEQLREQLAAVANGDVAIAAATDGSASDQPE